KDTAPSPRSLGRRLFRTRPCGDVPEAAFGVVSPRFPYPWLFQNAYSPYPVYITQSFNGQSMPQPRQKREIRARNGALFRKVCLLCCCRGVARSVALTRDFEFE